MEPKFLHDYYLDEDLDQATTIKWVDADGKKQAVIPSWLWRRIVAVIQSRGKRKAV